MCRVKAIAIKKEETLNEDGQNEENDAIDQEQQSVDLNNDDNIESRKKTLDSQA